MSAPKMVAAAASLAVACFARTLWSPQTLSGRGYYSGLDFDLRGEGLKQALQERVRADHTVLSYREVWDALEDIDLGQRQCPAEMVYDVYADKCWLPKEHRCSNSKNSEGQCYNREHVWPKSWYGGFEKGGGAETDLISLFAVDGFVNRLRSNFPYGEVLNATHTSKAGAKVGPCTHSELLATSSSRVRGRVKWFSEAKGYGFVEVQHGEDALVHISDVDDGSKLHKGQAVEFDLLPDTEQSKGPRCRRVKSVVDTCFEPPDAVKGDLARALFYVSVRYQGQLECCRTDAVDAHRLNKWLEDVLRRWHVMDSVDDAERRRNDLIHSRWQRNRNPFVDFPHLVSRIDDF